MKPIPITIRGIEKLKKELNYLKYVRRPAIIQAIAEARQHGDLKENAEYHAAREQQEFCENKIKEISIKLSVVQVIDITKIMPSEKVIFGSTVSIKNIKNNDIKTYCIVGEDETEFKKGLISINSPIARGLIGKKKGDFSVIKTPGGNYTYEIIDVQYI